VISLLLRALRVNRRRHIAILFSAVAAVIVAGGAVFAGTQGIPVTTGLYWAITTATTVGYGDVTPRNASGRVVASIVMLTAIPMLAAAFALVTGSTAAAGVRRILSMATRFPEGDYRLVVGMHPAVPAILDELVAAGNSVVLVADVSPADVRDGVHVVRGDPTQPRAIAAGRPAGARQALITGASDGDVLVSAVQLRGGAPDLPVVALVRSPAVRDALHALGIRMALSADELIAHTLAKSLETPHAGDLIAQLVDSERHRLVEADAGSDAAGKRLSALRAERTGLVLGLVHDGLLSLGIGADPVVAAGDRLLVVEPAPAARHAARRGFGTMGR
jgi:voltage-gated potassium channel